MIPKKAQARDDEGSVDCDDRSVENPKWTQFWVAIGVVLVNSAIHDCS